MSFRAVALVASVLLASACGESSAVTPARQPASEHLAPAPAAVPASPVATAETPRAGPDAAPGDPPRTDPEASAPLTELAGRFEAVRETAGKAPEKWEWFLWRREARVETRETLGGAGEVWERDAAGRVGGHLKVFHAERRVIEYVPGDLAALGATTEWDTVTSVFPEARLASLRRVGDAQVLGRAAVRYAGRLGAAEYDVTWIPSLRLPGAVRKAADGQFLSFRLREVHPFAASPWAPPDASSYQVTEFSDVGCGSTDPFLRRFHAYLASANHAMCR